MKTNFTEDELAAASNRLSNCIFRALAKAKADQHLPALVLASGALKAAIKIALTEATREQCAAWLAECAATLPGAGEVPRHLN